MATPQVLATGQISLVDLNDAKTLSAFIGAGGAMKYQVFNPNDSTYSPDWTTSNVVLTPQLYLAGNSTNIMSQAVSIKWYEVTSSASTQITSGTGGYTIGAANPWSLTIAQNKMAALSGISYRADITWPDPDLPAAPAGANHITISADIDFVKVSSGQAGVSGVLSNDSHQVATDSAGNNGTYGFASTMTVYEGAVDKSASWAFTATPSTGVTGTASNSNRTYTISGMTVDSGTVTFVATRSGYPSVTRVFSVSKNKQGIAGTTPTSYWLVVDASAVQKSAANAYTPATIVLSGKSQVGTAAPGNYAARFTVEESTNGTSYTAAKYTSAADIATYTYTPTAWTSSNTVRMIRVKMFQAGGTSVLLDEQVIPIVMDGNNAVNAFVSAPRGNILNSMADTLVAHCDVLNGGVEVTTGVTYQWYKMDPGAATAVGLGGDTEGGNGWRVLETIANPTAAPTLAQVANAGSTVAAATYYVKYTWVSSNGETIGNTTAASLAVTAGNNLNVTVPAFPDGVRQAKIYIGTAAGTLRLQGSLNAAGTYTRSTVIDAASALIPTESTASYSGAIAGKTGVTNFTTNEITIPIDAIDSMSTFKCVATYNGTLYSDIISLVDMTDPIQVTLYIPEGNIYRNGVGTKNCTAKLYKSGVEIDEAGTDYEYRWTLLKADGTADTRAAWVDSGKTYKTGKTVAVPSDHINGTGTLFLELWSK